MSGHLVISFMSGGVNGRCPDQASRHLLTFIVDAFRRRDTTGQGYANFQYDDVS